MFFIVKSVGNTGEKKGNALHCTVQHPQRYTLTFPAESSFQFQSSGVGCWAARGVMPEINGDKV